MNRLKKLLLITTIVLIFTIGCTYNKVKEDNSSFKYIVENNENLIKNTEFLEAIEEFSKTIMGPDDTKILGNLDSDNIPDLVVFKTRDPDDLEDPGYLELYAYDGGNYVLKDSVSMNYDNSNYLMVIGNVSKDQKGLLLSNQVGSHSGLTYGFILEDGKLKNIFNENKISVLSVYTENEIKDINGDGILEFSVYTIDPETEDRSSVSSDKMTLWYRWNGNDSADLVSIEREDVFKHSESDEIYKEAIRLIQYEPNNFMDYLIDNLPELSKFDTSELIILYLESLNENLDLYSDEIDLLFSNSQMGHSRDFTFNKYGLTIDKINNIDYLIREKVLKDEPEVKNHLIEKLSLGYKLQFENERYYYKINYDYFLDTFKYYLTNEATDYLLIVAKYENEPYLVDNFYDFQVDELTERISFVDSFLLIYPYSKKIDQVSNIYKEYVKLFIYGTTDDSNFSNVSFQLKKEAVDVFHQTIKKYEYTRFANILTDFLDIISKNNYRLNKESRAYMDNILD